MTALEQTATGLPTGTWAGDAAHSTVDFRVRHMVVGTFRGTIEDFESRLVVAEDDASLTGSGRVASIVTRVENLTAHLAGDDFFDAASHPELRFASRSIRRSGDELVAEGDLTIRGVTRPVELRGEARGPVTDLGGKERLGLDLETTIDRRDFGMAWNAPLPGGGVAVGNEVQLTAHLELVADERE